jgi:hypothetical protein
MGAAWEFSAYDCHSEPFAVILSRAKDRHHFSLRVNSAKHPRLLKRNRFFAESRPSEMQSFFFVLLRVRMTSEELNAAQARA